MLDWKNKLVVAYRLFNMPQAVWVDADQIIVGERLWNHLLCFTAGEYQSVHEWSHPHLANIHTIEKNPFTNRDVYLITSADSDRIVELNEEGNVLWEWYGKDHGYVLNGFGQPIVGEPDDYRPHVFHSMSHAIHPNSATYFDEQHILATFFHQGHLVKINKVCCNKMKGRYLRGHPLILWPG